MKTATVVEIGDHFQDYLKSCKEEPVVIVKNRRPVAILMNVHEDRDELERLILSHTPRFQALVNEAEGRILASGGLEHDKFWGIVADKSGSGCAEPATPYKAQRRGKNKVNK